MCVTTRSLRRFYPRFSNNNGQRKKITWLTKIRSLRNIAVLEISFSTILSLCVWTLAYVCRNTYVHIPVQSPLQSCLRQSTDQRECVRLIMNDTFRGLDLTQAYYISISIYSLCLTRSAKALSKSKSFITDRGDLNRRGDLEVGTSSEGDSASLGTRDNEEQRMLVSQIHRCRKASIQSLSYHS